MSLFADSLSERRRMARRLSLWRGLAVFAAVVAVFGIATAVLGRGAFSGGTQHIARFTVSGVITGDRATQRLIESIGRSNAAAVIMVVDSPGGTVPGSEALHESVRRLSEKKPVVAVVNTLAASGGYIAAMGADRIIARQTALVGSIGVIFQFPNVSQLLDKVGVKVETVRSAPLKAAPSGTEPTSPEAREAVNALVQESYDWFRTMVKTRRNLSDNELGVVSDGRVFSGRQGLPLKLVDEIGSEREAIAWLERERGVAKDLTVREYRRRSNFEELGLPGAIAQPLRWVGLDDWAQGLVKQAARIEALTLDGLLALWQPATDR